MKEPGLDGRPRDRAAPKKGEIQQKRGDTLNKNLPKPIRSGPAIMLSDEASVPRRPYTTRA
jgi:hypothetical protein